MSRFRPRLTPEQHAAALAAFRADSLLYRAADQDAKLRAHEAAGALLCEQAERERCRQGELEHAI